MGIGDLRHVLADLDAGANNAVLFLHCDQFIHAAEHRGGLAGDEPLAHAEYVHLRALEHQVADEVFVQGVGRGDLAVGQSGVVQHLAGALGQVGNIAAVQADGTVGDALGDQHVLEGSDGVGDAGLQGVVGVHQERGIVGVQLAIGAEGLVFVVKHLHPGVGHGAAGRHTVHGVGEGAGSTGSTADVGRAGADDSAVRTLSAAGAKLQHGAALSSPDDAVGLGGDQALMIDGQQQVGFNQLRLNGGSLDGQDGLVGEDGRAFRDSVDITGEFEVAQIIQEGLVKVTLGAQVGDVIIGEVQLLDVFHDLLQAGRDGKAAAVRHGTVEYVKHHILLVEAVAEITVAHRDLIKVKEHGQIAFRHGHICYLFQMV